MLNPKLKKLILSFSLGRTIHSWAVKRYRDHIFNARCRQLRKVGPDILRMVHERLAAAKIEYFADYGTLLGIVRDKGFIRHDDDIDFSIPPGGARAVDVVRALQSLPDMVLHHGFECNGEMSEVCFRYKGIDIDFFFMEIYGNVPSSRGFVEPDYDYQLYMDPWRPRIQRRSLPIGIHEVTVGALVSMIPDNYDEVLTTAYGNWREPVKGWHGDIDTGQSPFEYVTGNGYMLRGIDVLNELKI